MTISRQDRIVNLSTRRRGRFGSGVFDCNLAAVDANEVASGFRQFQHRHILEVVGVQANKVPSQEVHDEKAGRDSMTPGLCASVRNGVTLLRLCFSSRIGQHFLSPIGQLF